VDNLFITREIMEAILKIIDEGIHVVDTSGNTIFYNTIAANHDGMKVKEVLGKHILDAFPSLTKETSTLLEVLTRGKPIIQKGQTYVNVHGKTIDTINSTLPIYVEGKLVGAVEVAKDYSKLRQLSERLLDLERKMIKETPVKAEPSNGAKHTFDNLITVDSTFISIIDKAKKLSRSSSTVLVYGESGSGKELFVQGLHNASIRRTMPFIAQNCAALPDTLLESILFGTAKGSYTGATDRPGLFELANGGTLFLDEVQSLPIELQAKLLRVLEDGLIRRIGGTKSISVNVRIMAAMNVHPEEAMRKNLIREDLFYRLNVLPFHLPPLRKRKSDISLLTNYFIEKYNHVLQSSIKGVSKEVEAFFYSYHWPGNVRELKHTIEFMINCTEDEVLGIRDLPDSLKASFGNKTIIPPVQPLRDALKETEQTLIYNAMLSTNGNILQAASLLGIPRQTLQYKLSKLDFTYKNSIKNIPK
jgi:arginine utilization regulatory protein